MGAIAPFDVRQHFTPDMALLEVTATALGPACSPSEPLAYEGLTVSYLPDQMLTGRTLRHRTQQAIYTGAYLRRTAPDLMRKAGGWETRIWIHAVSAVVLYTPSRRQPS